MNLIGELNTLHIEGLQLSFVLRLILSNLSCIVGAEKAMMEDMVHRRSTVNFLNKRPLTLLTSQWLGQIARK